MTATIAPPILPTEAGDPNRLLPIAVNLLPDEILAARAGRSARTLAIAIMVIVAVAVGSWYFKAHSDSSAATDDLAAANAQVAAQVRQQRQYAGLTKTKADISALRSQLVTATTGNVAWGRVIAAVRSTLPTGVHLTGITAKTTDPNDVAPSSSTPAAAKTPSLEVSPGSVLLTGTASTKNAVSAYANRLATAAGLTNPLVTSVQRQDVGDGVTFGLQFDLTKKILSTRYNSKAGE